MARVKFNRGTEAKIKSINSNKTATEGTLYLATDTGTMWYGNSDGTLLQVKDNINTTYGIFSGSTNGLAPSTASGNLSTTNVTTSQYVLTSDGKWHTLPDNAWNNSTYTLSSLGGITPAQVDSKIATAVASAYRYKGSVASDKLPTSGQVIGDVYNLTNDSSYGKAGMNVAWNGSAWDALGSNVDLSNYALKSSIPSVSNATITIKQTGKTDQTFTLNGGATTISLNDNNTTYLESMSGTLSIAHGGTGKTSLDDVTVGTSKSVTNTGGRVASANVSHGDGKLYYYLATSSMTTGKPPEDAHILHFSWDSEGGWDSQLSQNDTNGGLYVRAQNGGTWSKWAKVYDENHKPTASDVGALSLSGGKMTGRITGSNGGSLINGRENAIVANTAANKESFNPVISSKTSSGSWNVGNLEGNENLAFSYDTDANYSAKRNETNVIFLPANKTGTIALKSDIVNTKYKANTTTIGSASNWSAGSVPTLGTAISADDITSWNAGSTPTLGTAITADDITAWSAGKASSTSYASGVLTITNSTVPSLTYTAKSIPNVTSVGSVPSLTYTSRSIPNVTSVGTLPSLTVSNVTVATEISEI